LSLAGGRSDPPREPLANSPGRILRRSHHVLPFVPARRSDGRSAGERVLSTRGRDAGETAKAERAAPRRRAKRAGAGVTAEEMGARQREISVSEFFTKNRHLLGFDSPRKALLTCVKEAVDNALDACEEGGILPDVEVKLEIVGEGGTPPPAWFMDLRRRITGEPAPTREAEAEKR